MRCVSYTQTASCYKAESKTSIPIADQNEHISVFAKRRKLRIAKKYSERKQKPGDYTEFEKMRTDGLNREFDTLIIDSIWQCGKDVYQAIRVLQDCFYPAGICIGIVQEDFFSGDLPADEVNAFFSNLCHQYRSHEAEVRNQRNPKKYHVETFGYRYDRENDRLEIDEESAAIVREIFSQIKSGMKPSEIAKGLTARGVENPGDYLCRTKGWKLRGKNRGWSEGTVYHISKEPKYAGRWERVIDGKNYADDCDPVVDPKLFDEVQEIYASRRHHKKICRKTLNPFMKMMTDVETGAKVIMKKNANNGIYDFHFQPPKPDGVCYERTCMEYHEAIRQVRSVLEEEKRTTEIALSKIESSDGQDYLRLQIKDVQDEAKVCLQKMADLIISEGITANGSELSELTDRISNMSVEIEQIKIAFSENNPWIRLFSEYDNQHDMTRAYLKQFADHVYIRRFEKISLMIREKEWKDRIPANWYREEQNGTSQ